MAMGLGRHTPLGRLGMLMLGKVGNLGMVMPLGKLGGWRPLGRELSRAGMVGNLGGVPGISAWRMEGSDAAADGGGGGGGRVRLIRKQKSEVKNKLLAPFPPPHTSPHSCEP